MDSEELTLTITYEQAGDQVVARIAEVPAAMSFGSTREQARDAVLDALRELALSYLEEPPSGGGTEASESVRIHAAIA